MGQCLIYPIPLFRTKGDMSRITYRQNTGRSLDLVNYAWYIEGADRKIIVDTGGSSEFFSKVRGIPTHHIQTLGTGLNKLGIRPNEVDLVIFTHLHTDHVAQAHQFQNAKMLVQRDELEFARNPHPLFAEMYHKEFFNNLTFETIDGDLEISDQVAIIRTPGHSKGGQSVIVKTSQGIVIISGLCICEENINPPPSVNKTMPVVIPTIHTDPVEAYDSLVRIKQMANIVIPIHDERLQQVFSIP